MQYNISFDIAALLNLSVILFIYIKKIRIHSLQNNVLLLMIFDCMFAAVLDILSSVMISYPHFFPLSNIYFVCTAFFILNISILFLYALYLITITDTFKNISLTQMLLLFLPEVICLVIGLSNDYHHYLFYFDQNLNYHRGTAMTFYLFVSLYYMLFSLFYVIRSRAHFEKAILYSLYSFHIIMLITAIIQLRHPTLLIELFAVSLCLLIMLLNIQKPEKLINSQTELLNRDAMNTILEKKFYLAENFTVISLKLKDLSFLNKTFGSSYVNATIKKVADFLQALC